MKRICKKMLVTLVVAIIVVNYILNPFCFAASVSDVVRDLLVSLLGTFVGVITWIPRALALAVGYGIDAISSAIAYIDGTVGSVAERAFITPFEIVFNETAITNVDFFDFSSIGSNTVVYKIRTAVAGWYYFMRLIAIAILLVILVYVGIRMAISTIAEDKARYKKMLVDWLASLALVFVLQYIMVFIIELSNALVKAMSSMRATGLDTALNDIATEALGVSVTSIGATIVFFLFVYQTFAILFTYINRMIRVAFLVIISPLITITYSIDKMGDGKAQALNEWLKEFVTSILIQPFHCVIYMVFVTTAIDLLTSDTYGFGNGSSKLAAAVIAILCMMFINDGEKIVRKIFSLNGDDNSSSIAKGAAVAGAALHKSKDIGKAARKGINMAKEAKPLAKGKEMYRESRSAIKAAGQTVAQKVSGKGGPGFSANYNMNKAKIEQRAQEKEKAREEKKQEKRYQKHKKSYTTEEQNEIKNRAREIMKQNGYNDPKASGEDRERIRRQALRQARIEKTREKSENGDFTPKVVKTARSTVKATKKAARNFANSTTGQVLKQNLSLAHGIAFGGIALGTEDPFSAIATGAAFKNSMDEFMSSSNGYIANEAARYAEVVHFDKAEEIEQAYDSFKDGTSEKKVSSAEESLELQLQGAMQKGGFTGDIDKEIGSILANMKVAMKKDPNADINQILQQAINQSGMTLDSNVRDALDKAAEEFKNATAILALGQTIDKGTTYGASVETLSKATAGRESKTPTVEDKRTIEELYNAGKDIRTTQITDERTIEIYKTVTGAGINIDTYIERMRRERSNVSHDTHLDPDEKTRFEQNYDANIQKLEEYRNRQNRNS